MRFPHTPIADGEPGPPSGELNFSGCHASDFKVSVFDKDKMIKNLSVCKRDPLKTSALLSMTVRMILEGGFLFVLVGSNTATLGKFKGYY